MLENICTDFEISNELKELEIETETYFYWQEYKSYNVKNMLFFDPLQEDGELIKAYTLEQILLISREFCSDLLIQKETPKANMATLAARLLIKLQEDKIICT